LNISNVNKKETITDTSAIMIRTENLGRQSMSQFTKQLMQDESVTELKISQPKVAKNLKISSLSSNLYTDAVEQSDGTRVIIVKEPDGSTYKPESLQINQSWSRTDIPQDQTNGAYLHQGTSENHEEHQML
jgi:hypothetical protein